MKGIGNGGEYQRMAPSDSGRFSPFVFADRAAFLLLCLYFLLWPVWYVTEAKLTARLGDFRVEHLAVIAIMVFGFGTLVARKAPIPGFWPLSLLLVYGGFSLLWSPDAKTGTLDLLNISSLLFFVKILAGRPSRPKSALRCFVAGSILMLLISVIRSDASSGEGLRLIFPAGIDANQLAVHGAIVIVILAAEVITSFEVDGASSLQFWCALALVLSLAVVIVLSGSRTGNLAAIVGTSLVLFVRMRASGKLAISHGSLMIIPALAMVGIMVVYPFMASKSGSLLERYREGFFEGDLSGRDMVWRAGVRYFSSSPKIMVLGGGLGGFGESVVDYLDKPLFEVAVQMGIANPYRPYPYFAAHNDFLRLACDLGVVGLSLFIAFYVQIIRACLRTPAARHESVLPLALICTLVVGAFGIDLVNFPLYPIALALAISPCVGLERT